MNPIELGKFIASLRAEKNLTQEELAEILFIDKRKVSRWECGTSTPEFDMLIKLSEILDVSLYELSICKRIEDETLTRKVINKFKGIKDLKKYNTKKKILISIFLLLCTVFLITLIYTIKYNDSMGIYEMYSTDNSYYLEGNYTYANDYNQFNIIKITFLDKNLNKINLINTDCDYEIYDNDVRILYILKNDTSTSHNIYIIHYTSSADKMIDRNKEYLLKVSCVNKNKINNHSFNFKLTKKYSNKLY